MALTEHLRTGVRAARAGRMAQARAAFQSALDLDPVNETALMWLGYLAPDPYASLAYITRALEVHPQSPRAYAALQWAWRRVAAPSPSSSPSPSPRASSARVVSQRPRAVVSQPQYRSQTSWVLGRLPALAALLLVVALVGGMVGLLFLADSPVAEALASAFARVPTSMATVNPPMVEETPSLAARPSGSLDVPSPMAAEPPVASAAHEPAPVPGHTPVSGGAPLSKLAFESGSTPVASSSPVPSPAPSAAPSPVPSPVPSPLPVSADLLVPEPFPIPGPIGFVPSTTLPIPRPVQPVPVAADAVNIVVLGSDQRPAWSEWHTDVIQVVSVQPSRGAVSVISIPRDLYVYIPSLWMSRINFADFYGDRYGYEGGGAALLRDTLLYNLGIRMDYYVRTNFDGLIGIVDTMGGVDIPVHCGLSDHWPYPDENGEYPILVMEPGVHHMDGETALWYARTRMTTSVFARERRQQQVLKALWHKGRDAEMLSHVPSLWRQAQDMVQTDLTLTEILDLARIALSLEEQNVRFYNIGADAVIPWTTPYGGSVFLPRWENIEPIVAEAMAPIPESRAWRTYIAVEVWNGTPNQAWDLLAVDRLYQAGFPAVVGAPDRRDYTETQLIIFSERTKGTGAGYLQQMFGLTDGQVMHRPGESSTFGFRLILGADYQTCP